MAITNYTNQGTTAPPRLGPDPEHVPVRVLNTLGQTVRVGSCNLRIWVLERGDFSVEAMESGEQAQLFDDILAIWRDVAEYTFRVATQELDAIDLVLVDQYHYPAIASVLPGAHVVLLEKKRWRELIQAHPSHVRGVAGHMLLHLLLRSLDSDESRAFEELFAFTWEAAVLLYFDGEHVLSVERKLALVHASVKDPKLATSYREHDVLMGLGYHVAWQLYTSYGLVGLEAFVRAVLLDKEDGLSAFDSAASTYHLRFNGLIHGFQQAAKKAPKPSGSRSTGQLHCEDTMEWDGEPIERRPNRVILYSTPWCGYCRAAAEWMRENHIPFVEKNVEGSEEAKKEYDEFRREHGVTGGYSFPTFDVNGHFVEGFDKEKIRKYLK